MILSRTSRRRFSWAPARTSADSRVEEPLPETFLVAYTAEKMTTGSS